jgi:hypothetical protein
MPLDEAVALVARGEVRTLQQCFLTFLHNATYSDQQVLCIDGELAVSRWIHYEALVPELEQLSHDLALPMAGSVAANLPRFKQNRLGRADLPPLEAYLSPEAVALINDRSSLSFSHFGYQRRDPDALH